MGDTSLYISDSTLEFDCRKLAATSAISFETNKKGFTATVERDKENLVFFSVPYDEGWSATVNGKAVEIEKVNSGFMAVLVPAGQSTIRFTYTTPGLYTGVTITALTAIIILLYAIIFTFVNKKSPKQTIYPEGEALLIKWRMDEIAEDRQEMEINIPETNLSDSVNKAKDIIKPEPGFKGGFKINTDFTDDK